MRETRFRRRPVVEATGGSPHLRLVGEVNPMEGPSPSEEPELDVLTVRNLSVRLSRGQTQSLILKDIDLTVRRGEVLGVLGESGSGKSTLAAAILGLLPAASRPSIVGSIRIDGAEVVSSSPSQLRLIRREKLGVIFQDPVGSLNPTMTIGQQLLESCDQPQLVLEWLERVGMTEPQRVFRSFPHQLSGGQCQRAMVAMALARRPALLIADEPTTALDLITQSQVLHLLSRLAREEQVGMLFITHDLDVAGLLADRVAVMLRGQIVETGQVAHLSRNAQHPYTSALLRARFGLDVDRRRPLPVSSYAPDDPRMEPATWPEPTSRLTPRLALELFGVSMVRRGPRRESRTQRILNGVNLRVHRGEAVAVLGGSGSGKTTLLRIAAELQTPTEGDVILPFGAPQMIFQDAIGSLTPWLTIGEHISERLRPLKLSAVERQKKTEAALLMTGLDPSLADRKPSSLSGGECQRVALARAVVIPPPLLLCDEPVSAMDMRLAAAVLNLLGTLRRRLDMGILFVTHDIAAARFVADRIVVIAEGRIVEEGEPDDIVQRPQHEATLRLLEAAPAKQTRLT